jgi:hypothetical protein
MKGSGLSVPDIAFAALGVLQVLLFTIVPKIRKALRGKK